MTAINKVLLCGRVVDPGPKLTYTPEGSPQCRFTLCLEEMGKEGQAFKLFVPVLVYNTHAEWLAEHINSDDLVLIDGKLRFHSWIDKQGVKQSKLAVMGWQVSLLVRTGALSTN